MSESIATGAELSAATFANFVDRLRHDCIGTRHEEHGTGQPGFYVEEQRFITGIDLEFTDDVAIHCDDSTWFSIEAFMAQVVEDEMAELDAISKRINHSPFEENDLWGQIDCIKELEGHTVTGFMETWETLNFHLTHDAAQHYIDKNHAKHKNKLRIAVESQYRCDEFNTIRRAILDGKLVFKE